MLGIFSCLNCKSVEFFKIFKRNLQKAGLQNDELNSRLRDSRLTTRGKKCLKNEESLSVAKFLTPLIAYTSI